MNMSGPKDLVPWLGGAFARKLGTRPEGVRIHVLTFLENQRVRRGLKGEASAIVSGFDGKCHGLTAKIYDSLLRAGRLVRAWVLQWIQLEKLEGINRKSRSQIY